MTWKRKNWQIAATLGLALLAGDALALTAADVQKAMRERGIRSWQSVTPDQARMQPPPELRAGQPFESSANRPRNSLALRGLNPLNFDQLNDHPAFASAETTAPGLPERFDWRNRNGVNYMSPADISQGECGSCVAFAAVSTLESQLNIACDDPGSSFRLSRQYMFSCGGGDCASGWLLSQAVNFIEEHGVPDQACLPYQSGTGENMPCSAACADATDRRIESSPAQKTRGWIDIIAIKRALLQGPLLANMVLYEDLAFYRDGVYRHVTGHQLGSHAITLIGWSDVDQAWIARNSFGTNWGDNGYFKVAWDDTDLLVGRYTWSFDVSDAIRQGICRLPR